MNIMHLVVPTRIMLALVLYDGVFNHDFMIHERHKP